jgi:hypothetical protein
VLIIPNLLFRLSYVAPVALVAIFAVDWILWRLVLVWCFAVAFNVVFFSFVFDVLVCWGWWSAGFCLILVWEFWLCFRW